MKHFTLWWRIYALLALFSLAMIAGFNGYFNIARAADSWNAIRVERTTNDWAVRSLWITNLRPATVTISGSWPTNVVFSNDYSGTIQVGSNFLTLADLRRIVAVKAGQIPDKFSAPAKRAIFP